MFEQLQDSQVQLMLALSKENIDNGQELKGQLTQTDMASFFKLCKEHELDGVVASHIMEQQLLELPDYWMKAYRKEKEHLGFLKDKAADICRIQEIIYILYISIISIYT